MVLGEAFWSAKTLVSKIPINHDIISIFYLLFNSSLKIKLYTQLLFSALYTNYFNEVLKLICSFRTHRLWEQYFGLQSHVGASYYLDYQCYNYKHHSGSLIVIDSQNGDLLLRGI